MALLNAGVADTNTITDDLKRTGSKDVQLLNCLFAYDGTPDITESAPVPGWEHHDAFVSEKHWSRNNHDACPKLTGANNRGNNRLIHAGN